MHAWRRQLEHPGDIASGDEMPRRPHDVRSQDPAFVEGLLHIGGGRLVAEPQREGPFRERVLLRLYGAEGGDQILDTSAEWSCDVLVVEALEGDVHASRRKLRNRSSSSASSRRKTGSRGLDDT